MGVYRRYGKALALSVTLVQGKEYTVAVMQCKTKDIASAASVKSSSYWGGLAKKKCNESYNSLGKTGLFFYNSLKL